MRQTVTEPVPMSLPINHLPYLKSSWNLEKRICAPLKCLDNDDCPGVSKPSSDPCWTREQQGRCNRETYECEYESSLSSNKC